MTSIEKLRGEFKIDFVAPDAMTYKALKVILNQAGFDARGFETVQDALKALKESLPHIILSPMNLPDTKGVDFLSQIQQISDEVLMIFITSDRHKALSSGAYDSIEKNMLHSCLISILDRTIESLYLQHQNEYLLDTLKQKDHHQTHSSSKALEENKPLLSSDQSLDQAGVLSFKNAIHLIYHFTQKASLLNDTEGVIECFMKAIGQMTHQPLIYLKYLPSHSCLMLTYGVGLDISEFKGSGISLGDPKSSHLNQIKNVHEFVDLKEFMLNVFQMESYQALPLIMDKHAFGLVVVCDGRGHLSQQKDLYDACVEIFKGFLQKTSFQERIENFIAFDLTTGAFNKKYGMKALDQEMSRTTRIQHPMSILYIDIDDFDKYVEQHGHQVGHLLLKMITDIFIKTSRKIDIVARIQTSEFLMILPHTDQQRAAIKAERLRRAINTIKFPDHLPATDLSISVGVSEYPTMAQDAISLIQIADNALYQVKKSTKNKVCIGKAPAGFQPEFTVIPQSQKKEKDS